MDRERRYWFRAKRYGWGWGLPLTWEGWVVLAGFVVLVVVNAVVFPPEPEPRGFLGGMVLLSAVLVGVCYLKGEPPRWRWGGR